MLPIGAPLTPCFGFIAIMGGIEQDHDGNLYVSVASCISDNRGVWKVTPDGTMTLLANLPGPGAAGAGAAQRYCPPPWADLCRRLLRSHLARTGGGRDGRGVGQG